MHLSLPTISQSLATTALIQAYVLYKRSQRLKKKEDDYQVTWLFMALNAGTLFYQSYHSDFSLRYQVVAFGASSLIGAAYSSLMNDYCENKSPTSQLSYQAVLVALTIHTTILFNANRFKPSSFIQLGASIACLGFSLKRTNSNISNHPSVSLRFWTRCFLTYSLARLILTTIQHTDMRLAPKVHSFLSYSLPIDFGVSSAFFLYSAKPSSGNRNFTRDEEINLHYLLFVILLISAILGLWNKRTDMTSLFKDSLPNTNLDGLTLSHVAPAVHICLLTLSSLSTLAPVFHLFSHKENRKVLVLSIIVNALATWQLMNISWLCLERSYPFINEHVSEATARFYVMLPNPSKLFPTENPLKSAACTLYHFTKDFFDGSHWEPIWKETVVGKRVVDTFLSYRVTVIPKEILVQGAHFIDYIREWKVQAFNPIHGIADCTLAVS
ncbi:MAG: hypothetical protein KDK71_01760 [Chlamydiia bacterium]|nr:hypothetical protein [Chlamydiia bacterium]